MAVLPYPEGVSNIRDSGFVRPCTAIDAKTASMAWTEVTNVGNAAERGIKPVEAGGLAAITGRREGGRGY